MIRRTLLVIGTLFALFIVLLLLLIQWPPAWDALFGVAYWLGGYGPGGHQHGS
jgi:hypothetical protein